MTQGKFDRRFPTVEQSAASWDRRARWLIPLVYVACLIAFIADVTVEIFYIPFGIFYIPLVCTAVFHRNPRSAWWLAGVSIGLAITGYFLPVIAPNPGHSLINRSLSIGAICVTAALVRHARRIQEALAEQTRRAEDAERVKSEVFTTLSQELQNPLHSVVSLSEIMLAGCRPDQRAPLAHVQASSKRLLAVIDNLIDLTTLEERPLATETVDVNLMVRQAADASRATASARQISVELDVAGTPLTAHADPWAVRRILENLIANAVKFSPAGSTVELGTERLSGRVALLVRDVGVGMSADTLHQLGEPLPQDQVAPLGDGIGTGLTLCRRLAAAMGAELAFDSEIGCGTTAILSLPA